MLIKKQVYLMRVLNVRIRGRWRLSNKMESDEIKGLALGYLGIILQTIDAMSGFKYTGIIAGWLGG